MSYGQAGLASASKYAEDRPRKIKERQKMKKSFKQRFKDWLFSDPSSDEMNISIGPLETSQCNLSRETSLRFEVHFAAGGKVVQTRRYDNRKDRHEESLYIVTGDQDFGKEIEKILAMEALKH